MIWITATPNPAHVGDVVTVCYNFVGSGETRPVTLNVIYDGAGTGQSLRLTPGSPCTTIVIPKNCTSVLIEDQTGSSGDLVIGVIP